MFFDGQYNREVPTKYVGRDLDRTALAALTSSHDLRQGVPAGGTKEVERTVDTVQCDKKHPNRCVPKGQGKMCSLDQGQLKLQAEHLLRIKTKIQLGKHPAHPPSAVLQSGQTQVPWASFMVPPHGAKQNGGPVFPHLQAGQSWCWWGQKGGAHCACCKEGMVQCDKNHLKRCVPKGKGEMCNYEGAAFPSTHFQRSQIQIHDPLEHGAQAIDPLLLMRAVQNIYPGDHRPSL